MNSIYERGYSHAMDRMGLDLEKIAGKGGAAKGLKRLFSGGKARATLPAVSKSIPTAQINQSLKATRGQKTAPSDFFGGASKKPPAPHGIDAFEAKLRGQARPASAMAPPTMVNRAPSTLKRPETVPASRLDAPPPTAPKAPVASTPKAPAAPATPVTPAAAKTPESPAQAVADRIQNAQPEAAAAAAANKPEVPPGLLRRYGKWALPAAAVGGGAYALTRDEKPKAPVMPQQMYGNYPGELPMY